MADRKRRNYMRLKRALDVIGSGIGLIALSPVMAIIALLITVRLGNPVLFRQDRPGRSGEMFQLVKFRTMHNVDVERGKITNSERMTSFGSTLRSLSLDELPSLWNILRGDMSIVGPRPLLAEYLPQYTATQARRHEVRPGLTGLAQVNGRNQLDWESRFKLDVHYVDHVSAWLDFKILLLTIGKVLKRDGIAAQGHVVGAPFSQTLRKDDDE